MKINYVLLVVLFSLYSNLAYSNILCAGRFGKMKEATQRVLKEAGQSKTAGVALEGAKKVGETTTVVFEKVKQSKAAQKTGEATKVVLEKVGQSRTAQKTGEVAKAALKQAQQSKVTGPVLVQLGKAANKMPKNKEEAMETISAMVTQTRSLAGTVTGKLKREKQNSIANQTKKTIDLVLLQSNIDSLGLKPRTVTVLKEAGLITYTWELIQFSERGLLSILGFGQKSLEEVKEILAEKNLELGVRKLPEALERELMDSFPEREYAFLYKEESGFISEAKKSAKAMVGEAQQARETFSEKSQQGWGNVARENMDNFTGGVKKSLTAMFRDAQQVTDVALKKVQEVRSTSKENKEENTKPVEDTAVEKKDEEVVVFLKEKNIKINPALFQLVESLELAPPIVDRIYALGIHDIGTLVHYEEKMLSIPYKDFDLKDIEEIKEALKKKGLTLGMRVENWPIPFEEHHEVIKQIVQKLGSKENKEENIKPVEDTAVEKKDEEAVVSKEDKESEDINPILLERIESLGLKHRIANPLKAEGVYFIGELVQFTEKELLKKIPGFGPKSLVEVKKTLALKGLQLGTRIESPDKKIKNGPMRML